MAKNYVYVSDDSMQPNGYKNDLVIGFAKADIAAVLSDRRPSKIYMTNAYGSPLSLHVGFSASSLYFDGDLKHSRLWVAETYRPGSLDNEEEAVLSNSRCGEQLEVSFKFGDWFGAEGSNSSTKSPDCIYEGDSPKAGGIKNPIKRAKLAGFKTSFFTGLLQGWTSSNVMHDVEVDIGADVAGAVWGYTEYSLGPQNIALNRCAPRFGFM